MMEMGLVTHKMAQNYKNIFILVSISTLWIINSSTFFE